jgi:hypothetical protein
MSSFFRELKQRKVYRVALGFPVALVFGSNAHS